MNIEQRFYIINQAMKLNVMVFDGVVTIWRLDFVDHCDGVIYLVGDIRSA